MERFELTFRFDNEKGTLTQFDGLSIEELGIFLKSLSKAVSDNEGKLVLSEIKNNCYAPVVTTTSRTDFERMKSLHKTIAEGSLSQLKKKEREYYRTLVYLTANDLLLSVYDKNMDFFKRIENLKKDISFPYFYSSNAVKGLLTRIGGRSLTTKNTIFVDAYPYEIEISETQERELLQYYKDQLIEFYITEKINKETEKIESCVLDAFKVLKVETFYDSVVRVRKQYGEYFSNALKQPGDE